MQSFRCLQCRSLLPSGSISRLRESLIKTQYRHYVRKQRPRKGSPSFGSNSNEKVPSDEAKEASDQIAHGSKWRRRLPGAKKVLLFSIIGFVGYRIYNWQTNPKRSSVFNSKFFTPFILKGKEEVSPTSSVLDLLSVPSGQNVDNVAEAWKTGVWSVQVMQPELQIARSYTPLPPTEGLPNELVRLFVRREDKGEVSGFLHRIPVGTVVHLRGPRVEFQVPDDVDEVLFLAGGTGIAPALQVAHCLFKARPTGAEATLPKMKILWANRRREDSRAGLEPDELQEIRQSLWNKALGMMKAGERKPWSFSKSNIELASEMKQTRLVEEVERFASSFGGKISVEYFVDEEGSIISESVLRSRLESRDSQDEDSPIPSTKQTKLLLVSGPDGFIAHFAGPKEWQGGKEVPGPLGGMLRKINPQGWDIWTL